MIRNIGGFAVFAFLAVLGFRLVFGIFGGLVGILVSILWWAFIGFVIYTIIKMFSPSTATKIRDTIRGDSGS
ncbi:MAG TPA: hypothetical protein PLL69_04505 [Gemmatimonadales bacterium]|nr:hypothetical protein [Gemmatimonadales bacterium]